MMKNYNAYKNRIEKGFSSKNELDKYLEEIAEDETISIKKYLYLRYAAIKKFYE